MDDAKEIKQKRNPRKGANIFSILTFSYTIPLFIQGFRKELSEEDVIEHLDHHDSQKLGERLENVWNDELKRKKDPSLFKCVLKVFGLEFFLLGIIVIFLELVVKIAQPIALAYLIVYYSGDDETSKNEALMYAGIIVFASFLNVIFGHTYMFQMQQLGMKLRVGLCSMIYRKTLRLSKTALVGTTIGQIVNLLSNDVSRCDHVVFHIHILWICPFATGLIIYILYAMLGLTSTVGVLFIVMFIPFQMYLGKRASVLRLKTALRTDERIRLMNEIISGIQVIKMYTWEKPFAKLVAIARKLEISHIRGTSYIRGTILSFIIFVTRFAIFLTILVYVLRGNKLTAEYVFIVTAFYNILRQLLTMNFPRGILDLAEFNISISRLKKFLMYDEIEAQASNLTIIDQLWSNNHEFEKTKTEEKTTASICLSNVSAHWDPKTPETLTDVSLEVKDAQLVALIGPVGCGKTSLLHVILKELPVTDGTVKVSGKVSYASQEPWVFSGSVRQNILFGEPMNELRYKEVIEICALKNDLQQFPYGDQSLVGERGVTLSGGQRARVNLARAIYKEADIYLLDDPLSAVDTHVGKQLFDQCIRSYLKNKCVVLVTHQIQFLNKVDYIYLIEDGKISEKGTYTDINAKNIEFAQQNKVEEDKKMDSIKRKSSALSEMDVEKPTAIKEQRSIGKISSDVYMSYFKSVNSTLFGIIIILLLILTQALSSGADYFLTYWVNLEQKRTIMEETVFEEEEMSRETSIYIYSGIVAAMIVITLSRSMAFFTFCMTASTNLHNEMFSNILNAPMRFFDTNASGRILNRFSKDMGTVDEILPQVAIDCFQIALQVLGVAVVITLVNPWLLIPTLIILAVFYLIRIVYLRTSRSLKRLEGVTRSPIFTHMNASLQGLTTIRAFSAETILKKEFDGHQNFYTSVFYSYVICSRAFGFWLDLICVIYIALVTFSFFLFGSDQYGGNVGLAITQALSLTGMFQWGMRQWTELETQMTSVERVVEYTKIEPEPNPQEIMPPPNWPQEGKIQFSAVRLRYSEDDPYVLKNVNFSINSKEKVGIVGRTGAGKSSLIYALFQLTPTEGAILIDDINITKIPLENLRSQVSIIPQEPVLFSGSIRKNLDPFNEYSDNDIWNALEEVELKARVSELPSGLNNLVSESGSNFSVGQRQLLCLARAIIRHDKILLMDEATANVDPHTDMLIQKTIRKKFVDCTVLTIAHRLNTVMDSDKVLVMNAGEAIEFDHPHLLLKDEESVFSSMVNKTGSGMSELLKNIAEENYKQKFSSGDY